MVRAYRSANNACGTKEDQKEMGLLKYDFNGTVAPDELYRPLQLYGKSYPKMGLSDYQTTGQTVVHVLTNTMLLEK